MSSKQSSPNNFLHPGKSKASISATNGENVSITGEVSNLGTSAVAMLASTLGEQYEAEDIGQEADDGVDDDDEGRPQSISAAKRRIAAQAYDDEADFAHHSDVEDDFEERDEEYVGDHGDEVPDDNEDDDDAEHESEQRILEDPVVRAFVTSMGEALPGLLTILSIALAALFKSMHEPIPGILSTLSIAGYAMQPRKNLYLVTINHGPNGHSCKPMIVPRATPISDLYNAMANAFSFSNFSVDIIDFIRPARPFLPGVNVAIRLNEHRARVYGTIRTLEDLEYARNSTYSLQVSLSVYLYDAEGMQWVSSFVVNMRFVSTTVFGENESVTDFPFVDNGTMQEIHRWLTAAEAAVMAEEELSSSQNGV